MPRRWIAGLSALAGGLAAVMLPMSAAQASDGCANEALRAQQSAGALPECRAYEQVSPVEKNGNDIAHGAGYVQAADAGDAAKLYSGGGFEGADGVPATAAYVARRTSSGWTSRGVTPPQDSNVFNLGQTLVSSPWDLTKTIAMSTAVLGAGANRGTGNIYLRDQGSGGNTYTLLAPGVSDLDTSTTQLVLGSWSADQRLAVFRFGNSPLTPDAPAGVPNLYAYANGVLSNVGILPDDQGGGPAPSGSTVAAAVQVQGGSNYRLFRQAVAADGSWVAWVANDSGNLYVRKHPGTAQASTSQVDATVGGGGTFAASAGNDIYFVKHVSGAPSLDLYRYDVLSGLTEDLAPGAGGVHRVLGVSDDGSILYFSAASALAPGAVAGQFAENVYALKGDDIRFIGRETAKGATGDDFGQDARVSPDGRFVIFGSAEPLLSYYGDRHDVYDNDGRNMYYIYDHLRDRLTCASCRVDGKPPTASVSLATLQVGGNFPGIGYAPRALTDDGRLFFNTADALVPDDVNGVDDVYESIDGRPSLISHGTSGAPAYLADSSADGRDVYFVTRDTLVAQDGDHSTDLYTARVEGGLAAQNPGAPVPCVGGACQGPPSALPAALGSASVTFGGPGDAAAALRPRPATVSLARGKAVRGSVASVSAAVSSAGTLRISGTHVRTVSRKLAKAATYRVAVRLSAAGKRSAKTKTLRTKVRVTFTPSAGKPASKTITLTYMPARRAASNGGR